MPRLSIRPRRTPKAVRIGTVTLIRSRLPAASGSAHPQHDATESVCPLDDITQSRQDVTR